MNVRSKIQLVTLDISQHDILIIYNTLDTPSYLIGDYKEKVEQLEQIIFILELVIQAQI